MADEWKLTTVNQIMVGGQMFRLDDIIFRIQGYSYLDAPDLFEFGPRYAQLFEPYRYLFFADYAGNIIGENIGARITDLALDPTNFITDPNEIKNAWIADLLTIDPNYHQIDPNSAQYDPDYTNRWRPGDPNYGKPDPAMKSYLREDFFIDRTLPVFTDPNMRVGGTQGREIQGMDILGWNATIGGYGARGAQSFLIQPLPINPFDGVPTYIPFFYSSIEAIKVYGKAHLNPTLSWILESALWNIGRPLWPNIAFMDFTPQYFEDLIITLEVTNGTDSDIQTFPISVVNYPVENYPPVLQLNVEDQIFYVGERGEYPMIFCDPDCFIFSLSQLIGMQSTTSHLPFLPGNSIRTDQDNLTYRMTLNGLPSYQYGPWIDSMIAPCSGLISFTPRFEGAYNAIVTCTDDRGAPAFGEITIFAVNRGTWLNHPPIIKGTPTIPRVIRAGEEVIFGSPDIFVEDPDGDEIYASCNIGSVGRTNRGKFIWTFQTNFPGVYYVEILFYDIRGGYAILEFPLEVKPWWSY